jgi:hypothetical protein
MWLFILLLETFRDEAAQGGQAPLGWLSLSLVWSHTRQLLQAGTQQRCAAAHDYELCWTMLQPAHHLTTQCAIVYTCCGSPPCL